MNAQHISTTLHPTQNRARSQTYTVNFFGYEITTVVTSTAAVAREWVYNLRNKHRDALKNSTLVVAIGVQYTPKTSRNPNPETAATLQLCVGYDCLIFQISHANNVPITLTRLLHDFRVTYVVLHVDMTYNLLKPKQNLRPWNIISIAIAEKWWKKSTERICSEELGFHGVVKPKLIGSSNWDVPYLSVEQVQYACVDVYITYLLAIEFGYPKEFSDSDEDEEEDDDDHGFNGGYLDYDDFTNPLMYDSDCNYVGYPYL